LFRRDDNAKTGEDQDRECRHRPHAAQSDRACRRACSRARALYPDAFDEYTAEALFGMRALSVAERGRLVSMLIRISESFDREATGN
jgi:hypothetical protein